MNFTEEIEKLILDNLKKTVPKAAQEGVSKNQLIDDSTKVMGFKKITKKGYTP